MAEAEREEGFKNAVRLIYACQNAFSKCLVHSHLHLPNYAGSPGPGGPEPSLPLGVGTTALSGLSGILIG